MKEASRSLINDSKKIMDIIFILIGLGMLTRISKGKFVFTGLRGMANQINGKKKKRTMLIKRHTYLVIG